jgi:cell division protein ZapA
MQSKSIKVRIFGSEYPLKGENEEFTKLVAAHVDGMLGTIHNKIPEQPPLTVAVLSALNIAEDLFKERERNSSELQFISSELMKLDEYIDGFLH